MTWEDILKTPNYVLANLWEQCQHDEAMDHYIKMIGMGA